MADRRSTSPADTMQGSVEDTQRADTNASMGSATDTIEETSKGTKRKASEVDQPLRRSRRGDKGVDLQALIFDSEDEGKDDRPTHTITMNETRSERNADNASGKAHDTGVGGGTEATDDACTSPKKRRGRPPMSEEEKAQREHDRRMKKAFIKR